MRLAELLETGQDQSVREARLVPHGGAVQLQLRLRGGNRLARCDVSGRWAGTPSAGSLATGVVAA